MMYLLKWFIANAYIILSSTVWNFNFVLISMEYYFHTVFWVATFYRKQCIRLYMCTSKWAFMPFMSAMQVLSTSTVILDITVRSIRSLELERELWGNVVWIKWFFQGITVNPKSKFIYMSHKFRGSRLLRRNSYFQLS